MVVLSVKIPPYYHFRIHLEFEDCGVCTWIYMVMVCIIPHVVHNFSVFLNLHFIYEFSQPAGYCDVLIEEEEGGADRH